MKTAKMIIAILVLAALVTNLAFAGNGHGGKSGGHGGGNSGKTGGSWNGANNANQGNNWNQHSNNWQHNKHNNYHYKYQSATPYYYYSSGYYRPVPQQPIVFTTPINVITPPAPAPKLEKVEVIPDTKLEMGGTVRITSERIRDSYNGRATMKIGHMTRKLEVIDWSDGYAVVKLPTLPVKTSKVVTIMVFNSPGKLAGKIDAILIQPNQYEDTDQQYASGQN